MEKGSEDDRASALLPCSLGGNYVHVFWMAFFRDASGHPLAGLVQIPMRSVTQKQKQNNKKQATNTSYFSRLFFCV